MGLLRIIQKCVNEYYSFHYSYFNFPNSEMEALKNLFQLILDILNEIHSSSHNSYKVPHYHAEVKAVIYQEGTKLQIDILPKVN